MAALMDALGVAAAGIAAVDQDGFPLRRDEERGGAALGVDEVNVEAARFLRTEPKREPGRTPE